jgi:hypothetical protein
MKTNVADKVMNVAATTVGKGLGEVGLGLLLGDVPRPRQVSQGGPLSGLTDTVEEAVTPAQKTAAQPRQVVTVDPWAVLLKWGGPLLAVGLGLVAFKAAWSWAGTAGRCTK